MTNRKRRFYQIHLSTVIVSTLVAGAILGLNFQRRARLHTYSSFPTFGYVDVVRGWPTDSWIAGSIEVQQAIKFANQFDPESDTFVAIPPHYLHIGENVISADGWYKKGTGERLMDERGNFLMNASAIPILHQAFLWNGVILNAAAAIGILLLCTVFLETVLRLLERRRQAKI